MRKDCKNENQPSHEASLPESAAFDFEADMEMSRKFLNDKRYHLGLPLRYEAPLKAQGESASAENDALTTQNPPQ